MRSLENAERSNQVLTEGVATRWYRAPEVLLGSKCYSMPADVWSFGCIIYEAVTSKPLFPGSSTFDQLEKIVALTGLPSEEDIDTLHSEIAATMVRELKSPSFSGKGSKTAIMKGVPLQIAQLLIWMLAFNQNKRITIEEILEHPLVRNFRNKEKEMACERAIRTSVDDNQKLKVDEYRRLIAHGQKNHSDSSSLPINNKMVGISTTKSNSSHFLRKDAHQSQLPMKQSMKNVSQLKQYRDRSTAGKEKIGISEEFKSLNGGADKSGNVRNSPWQLKAKLQKSGDKMICSATVLKGNSESNLNKSKKLIPPATSCFYSPKANGSVKKSVVLCCPFSMGKNVVVETQNYREGTK